MLSAEVDEHAITRRVFGERRGHVRGVGQKVKGIRSSTSSTTTSNDNFGPVCSSSTTPAKLFATRAEIRETREMIQSYGNSMWHFIASLQTQFPNYQIPDNLFPQFQQFDQHITQDAEKDEDEDADLGDD